MALRRVLVTGAGGRIGSAFYMSQGTRFDLRLADINPGSLPDSSGKVVLDVTDYAACLKACEDMDTVLHLAADPNPDAPFMESLLPINIVGTYNMLAAAQAQGCKRFIFASSAQAIEGYPTDVQIDEDAPARPGNLYGASKAFGEAMASLHSNDGSMTTVAVRIANVADFKAGETHSARDVAAFVSYRDVVALLARCIEAELQGFTVVNGVSDNRYKRLSIEKTKRAIGYAPRDDAFEILGL
ncbi:MULTISPECIES: NAD-dependent epimerase/dehydratase family protein [unclassified Luteibacter]|uniref:NAD-dependent epimerase/dehydratase family protein n=1 Tax=unclassified Luteibacter TaxID=2620188 RepID=UPI0005656CF3|nr:NAD(P)-dependent oxidoreductase [Luteibacter sp. 9135]